VSATGQLPLSIITDDEATLANFQSRTSVLEVVNGLSTLVDCRRGEYFLWGAEGVGKSHLLQAVSHALGTHALYLPLEDLTEVPPQALLEGADTVPVLALDNVQAVLQSPIGKRPYFIYSTADEMRGSRYCSVRTERLASLSRYCLTYALD
jgi:hypothetical protein